MHRSRFRVSALLGVMFLGLMATAVAKPHPSLGQRSSRQRAPRAFLPVGAVCVSRPGRLRDSPGSRPPPTDDAGGNAGIGAATALAS